MNLCQKRFFFFLTLFSFLIVLFFISENAKAESIKEKKAAFPDSSLEANATSDTTQVAAHMKQLRYLLDKGKFDEALTLLQPYLEKPQQYPRFFSDYLVFLVWSGKPKKAVEQFERLWPDFPKRIYLLRNMADAYYSLGRFNSAAALYRQIINNNPDDELASQALVHCYLEMGELESARRLLIRFSTRTPGSLRLKLAKAALLLRKQKYVQATNVYYRAFLNHAQSETIISTAKENAFIRLTAAQRKEMIAQIEKALEENPKLTGAYIVSLVLNKDYREAISYYESHGNRITDFKTDESYWIGWAYFKVGSIETAMATFNQILNKFPGFVRAKIGNTYCLAKLKKWQPAWNQLYAITPVTDDVQFAKAYIFEQSNQLWAHWRV